MVETRKKYKKVEKLRNFQNSPKTFPNTLFDHVLHDYFDGKKLWPVHPRDSKKFHRNRKEFKFSKLSKNVSKIVQTCFDVIFSRFFGQCTLEGRDVEKFQRNAKTSQNSRYPNTFPKVFKQVLDLFWGFFSKKTAQCTLKGRNLEQFGKKSKTIWNFKSVQKRSLECPNMFWGDFIEIFCSVHPGGSRSRKISKNGKKIKFSKSRKTFPKVSKFVLRWFFRIFLDQCTLEIKNSKKESKKFEFLKLSKNVLKSFQTSFELVLRYFSEKNFAQCTLEGRNMKKHQKNGKTFICFSKCPKTFPEKVKHILNMLRGSFFGKNFCPVHPGWSKLAKNTKQWKNFETFKIVQKRTQKHCLIMFCMIISTEKKLCPVHPGDWKKFHRNRKELKFSKMSKNVSKIVQTCFDVIFSRFFGQCTLEGREVEKFQRNAKTSQNSRYPHTFPKVSKQVLNLFWGFFSKKSAQCTLEGRNLEKLKKNWKT